MLQFPDVRRDTRSMRASIVLLAVLVLGVGLVPPARAQDGGFSISIASPIEAMTFYAGPTSLAYSIPISGQVTGTSGNPAKLVVQLEIFQDGKPVATSSTKPNADGTFSFHATINPEHSAPNFTPVELESHCEDCHYRAELDLPRGHVLLRVTARGAGAQAIAERHITVDQSSYIDVPVKVVPANAPEGAAVGVPVVGTAWMYLWRARTYSATTDAGGQAVVQLEALAQAPTRYTFRVDPTVVNGLLYESVEPVQVTLPPGAGSAPQVTLRVRSRAGQVTGTLAAPSETALASIAIRAIHLPDGVSFRAQTSAQGTFAFSDMPIGQYLLVVEPNERGLTSEPQTLDLAQSASITTTLAARAAHQATLRTQINDESGVSVPFAWVTLDQTGITLAYMPGLTEQAIPSLPYTASKATVTAPGFYSRKQVITPGVGTSATLEMALVRRPETRTLPWGSGQVIVPPESLVTIEDHQVTLERGWLWGRGDGQAMVVRTPEGQVMRSNAAFALERVSDDAAWLYITQGEASVTVNSGAPIAVRAGEMVALVQGMPPRPVPIDPVVVAALHASAVLPVASVFEPTGEELARTQIAQTGITAAQVVTFAVYFLAALSIVLAPLAALLWWTRHRKIRT